MIVHSAILQYIIVILCNAFDFWTVKNVTGRLDDHNDVKVAGWFEMVVNIHQRRKRNMEI